MTTPAHVLITSELAVLIFRRPRDGRPAAAGVQLSTFVDDVVNACERANDWTHFLPALSEHLIRAGYYLAPDFTEGHAYSVELAATGHAVENMSHSFARTAADLDRVECVELGKPHEFARWARAHVPDSDGVVPLAAPAKPAPAPVAKPAPKAKPAAKPAPAPRKVVAPPPVAADPDRLAKARAILRANLRKPAQARAA